MKIFEGKYLFSDIDFTLGVAGIGIPQRNKDAIRHFTEGGGKFGVATGRYLSDIIHFVRDIDINAYSIINNGAAIYDFKSGRFKENIKLPDRAFRYFEKIADEHPEMGLIAVNDDGYFYVKYDDNIREEYDGGTYFPWIDKKDIKGPYYKFLFAVKPEDAKDMTIKLNSIGYDDVEFIQTSAGSIEMVPMGISKGNTFDKICSMYDIPRENTYFIGDSFNDEAIMKKAGHAACVKEAPDELKSICSFIAGSCMDGAVADFIYEIEKNI